MRYLVLVLLAGPAFGQDALVTSYRATADACWQAAAGEAEAMAGCDGLLSKACMDGEPGGMSNTGMSQCLYAESAWWDEKLNEVWAPALDAAKRADAASRDYEPEFAVREDRLRAAQRAWIGFRDAQCTFDYSIHGSGSLRLLYGPSCLADLTRKRTLELAAVPGEF